MATDLAWEFELEAVTASELFISTPINYVCGVDPVEVSELVAENRQHRQDLASSAITAENQQRNFSSSGVQTDKQRNQFDFEELRKSEKQLRYYTGFSTKQFDAVYKFLVPDGDYPINLPSNRQKEIMCITLENQLLLVIMKLRHDFDYVDLGYRFGASKQTVSILLTHWINYMFLRCGEVSIWPPRDTIFQHMPQNYQQDFPTTFAIFDCTEMKICKPSSLSAQSQTFSDYKSTNTLKSLVACDPRGSIIYASMLFAGSMSDKEIFKQSGCQDMLKELVKEGYLKEGDGVMADKGFNIHSEVEECGLKLNIPPFARSGVQMTKHDALHTKKIAAHRVHVERAIARIKRFQIVARRLPLSLYTSINQIWYVCAFLSNFFNPCIQDK
ncbi:uncharacterized protein LOC132548115 [Ylistrum balloti]|uniref:uncharacterized protein LOC132548115 n=1 Tax=Ylistrum balloti TaxID=509963 RepID=UPI002905DC0C|nr:uncharacterized protein LOC132548115 [Ylistrum balloti]